MSWASIPALTIVALANGACGSSPAAPTPTPAQADLVGQWVGGLAQPSAAPPGLGDWSHLILTLQATGQGELVTNDGKTFSITDIVSDNERSLNLVLTPYESCVGVVLNVRSVSVNSAGQVDGFSGILSGRWCSTLVNTFTFTKGRAAP